MGGVGDQRQPLGDEAPREAERERNRLDARSEAQRAELQGEAIFELAQEILGRQRRDRLGVGVALVPDDAGESAAHRQDRRTDRRAGNAARRDLRGRARGRSSRSSRSGPVSQPTVGTSASARSRERAPSAATTSRALRRRPSASSSSADVASRREAGHGGGDRLEAERRGRVAQRVGDVVVERHMGERFVVFAAEAQLLDPHRVARAAVIDRHAADRLGERRQRRPRRRPARSVGAALRRAPRCAAVRRAPAGADRRARRRSPTQAPA